MHAEAFAFVKQFATDSTIDVIEVGSRNINGTVRGLFPNARWTGLDLHPGPDVDVVCDMLDYTPPDSVDLIVCCEVLEHAERWSLMLSQAQAWLKPGGRMILTCAGPGRIPHSHIDGGRLRPDEYYANVSADDLRKALEADGLYVVICTQLKNDTQAMAICF